MLCDFPLSRYDQSSRNMLYIYPQALDFRSGKGRNVGVKVQFMAGEDREDALPCIYGKSCSATYLREAWCPVLYHNKLVSLPLLFSSASFLCCISTCIPAPLGSLADPCESFGSKSCGKLGCCGFIVLPTHFFLWINLCRWLLNFTLPLFFSFFSLVSREKFSPSTDNRSSMRR